MPGCRSRFALLASPLVLVHCQSAPAAPEVAEGAVRVAPSAPPGCPDEGCGTNSPVVGGVPFHELNLRGEPNKQGIFLEKFRDGSGRRLILDVRNAELVGLDPETPEGPPVLSGAALQGTTLQVSTGSQSFDIHIEATGSMPFWAGAPDPVTTYHLVVDLPGGGPGEGSPLLCSNPPAPGGEWPSANVLHAVVFDGERYDLQTKTVTDGASAEGWFNIACMGSASAKMHLVRHTEAGADPQTPTTVSQRQAMLRMFTAAYCPSGKAYTVAGERLLYRDAQGLIGWPQWDPGQLTSYESVWTDRGAACLDVARLDVPSQATPEQAAELLDGFMRDCGPLPPCTVPGNDFPSMWQGQGYVLSANPFPY